MINFVLTVVASPSPAPDVEAMMNNALNIGAALPGALGALFVGLIIIAWAIIKISKYFESRGQREKEAYDEDVRIRRIQADNTSRMQVDAVAALLDNMDISYKQDYEYFVAKLKENKYSAVYAKTAPQFQEKIAAVIYQDSSPEFRAARIIQIIRKV